MDPLATKYPSASPYSFVANNPIINREIDGRDYAVYVDHNTKTITIRSIIYVQNSDLVAQDVATKSANFWNGQSGLYYYQPGGGAKYDIQFSASVIMVDDPEKQAKIDRKLSTGLSAGEQKIVEDLSSNYLLIKPAPLTYLNQNGETTIAAGLTTGNKIEISSEHTNIETGAHEKGHTLGIGHGLGIGTVMAKNTSLLTSLGTHSLQIEAILANAGIINANTTNAKNYQFKIDDPHTYMALPVGDQETSLHETGDAGASECSFYNGSVQSCDAWDPYEENN